MFFLIIAYYYPKTPPILMGGYGKVVSLFLLFLTMVTVGAKTDLKYILTFRTTNQRFLVYLFLVCNSF